MCRGLYDIIPSAANAFFLSAVSYIHINPDVTQREHAGVWSGPESPYVAQTKKKKKENHEWGSYRVLFISSSGCVIYDGEN